jgi:hypothetical protein
VAGAVLQGWSAWGDAKSEEKWKVCTDEEEPVPRTLIALAGAWVLWFWSGTAWAEAGTVATLSTWVGFLTPPALGIWLFVSKMIERRQTAAINVQTEAIREKTRLEGIARESEIRIAEEDRRIAREEAAEDRRLAREVAYEAALAAARATQFAQNLTHTAADQAVKLEEISRTLQDQNIVIASSHDLGNSAMDASLTITARIAREKANDTGSKSDLVAAELAEAALAEHKKKQQRTDAAAGGAGNVKDAVAALLPKGTTDADIQAAKDRMSRPKGEGP